MADPAARTGRVIMPCPSCGGPTDQPLCPGCDHHARADITALVTDYISLSRIVARQHSPGEVKIARAIPGSAPPINLTIDALRTAIVWTATIWEEVLRDADRLADGAGGPARQLWTLSRAVAVIAPRVTRLAGIGPVDCYAHGPERLVTRTGAQGLAHLRRLHRAALDLTGRQPRTVRLPGVCPACDAADLRRDDGSDRVYCGPCGWACEAAEYRGYVQLSLAAGALDPWAVTGQPGGRYP